MFFLGVCVIWSCVCHVAFAMITLTIPAQVLAVALHSVAVVAVYFPDSAVLVLVLGISFLG